MKILFATEPYQYLADEILKEEDNEFVRGELIRQEFPDGERYLKLGCSVKGANCTIVSSTQGRNLLEIYDLGNTLVQGGARKLTIVIPYYAYSTMEKGTPGEVIKAKTRADLLSSIPKASYGNEVVLFELHNDAIQHYFCGVTAHHLSSRPIVMKACVELAGTDFVLASTDVGRAKSIEYLQRAFRAKHRAYNVDTAFAYKSRKSGTETDLLGIGGTDVKDRTVVIYDDMIRTGGSLIEAAEAYVKAGAFEVFAITTHGVLPGNSLSKIQNAKYAKGTAGERQLIKQLAVTNSHSTAANLAANNKYLRMYSIAGLLTKYG